MRGRARLLVVFGVFALIGASCGGESGGGGGASTSTPEPEGQLSPAESGQFTLTSSAFGEGDPVPEIYSCDGENVSPPLEWSGVPEGTVELVLTLRDPDAPGAVFTHWTVFGMDPSTVSIEEGALPTGALEGMNHFGDAGYGGPCPPQGPAHRYVFTLAALDEPSGLETGAPPEAVEAMVGGAAASTTLTGSYPS